MRARVIGLAAAAAVIVVMAIAISRYPRGPTEPTTPGVERTGVLPDTTNANTRELVAGIEHRYAIELQHTSRPTEGEPFALGVGGEWALAVVSTDDHGVTTIRAELRSARVRVGDRVAPAAQLAVPYTFTLGRDGRLLALQFPRDLATETRMLLTAITATAQVTDGGRAPTWTAVETDSLGPYDARYTRVGEALHKVKVGYRARAPGEPTRAPLGIDVVKSATDLSLRRDGWLAQLDHRETVRVGLDKVTVEVDGHVVLRHTGSTRGAVAALPAGLELMAIDATSVVDRDAHDRELLDGATFVDLLATLASVRDDSHASAHTYLRLVALFRLDAEAAKLAGREVIGGKLDRRDAGAVIGALGEAGTRESQHALVEVIETKTVANEQRVHGALALGLTGTPQPETIATLATASRSTDEELSATATLALGNAALRLRNQDGVAAAAQVDDLLARLRAAGDPATQVIYLRALGNTGDVRVLPALEAAMAADSDMVRAAATESLRLVPDARADALIVVALGDRSSIVRTAAVFAASHRQLDPMVNALAARARGDADVTVRRAIVELAGTRMNELPTVLRPIVAYAAEHDVDSELREAAKKLLI